MAIIDLLIPAVHLTNKRAPCMRLAGLIRDYPELLTRMDYYAHARSLNTLHSQRAVTFIQFKCAGLIRDYPELLIRMDYYAHARSLDDLPIEMQNVRPADARQHLALHAQQAVCLRWGCGVWRGRRQALQLLQQCECVFGPSPNTQHTHRHTHTHTDIHM